MEGSNKKSLKWLWIVIAAVVVAALAVWCIVCAINHPKSSTTIFGEVIVEKEGVENVLNFNKTFALFTIAFA